MLLALSYVTYVFIGWFKFLLALGRRGEIFYVWPSVNCTYIWAHLSRKTLYVSESDILGPIDYFSDMENLVSFERAMFADYSFKY